MATTKSCTELSGLGWFTLQIESGDFFALHDYGRPGEWIILDQGNEIPDEMLAMGPWATAEDAIAAAVCVV
jgi:hypothetical protein